MKELLEKLNACEDAKYWATGKSWEEAYSTCNRGDWPLWLFQRTNPEDIQLLTLAKGHCANTVRHLMKDERSLKAVDAAIAFGEGKISREELDAACGAAGRASWDAADGAARAAYYASNGAARAVTAAAAAYSAAYAAGAAGAAAWAASADAAAASAIVYDAAVAYCSTYKENQKLTADICRKYLPIEIWNIQK
jgi:hypothetical protein